MIKMKHLEANGKAQKCIHHEGKSWTVREFCYEFKLSESCLRSRMKLGQPFEQLSKPVRAQCGWRVSRK